MQGMTAAHADVLEMTRSLLKLSVRRFRENCGDFYSGNPYSPPKVFRRAHVGMFSR